MFARRFTNRLLLANLGILLALLVCGGLALSFVLGGFLRSDFQTQQGYRVDKMAEQLDGVLDEMNRLSISILASRRISDILLGIPRDDRNNYFLNHPATRYEVLNLLLSYTALKPLKGRICLVSDKGDLLDLSNQQDTIAFTKPELSRITATREAALGAEPKALLPPGPEPWSSRHAAVIALVRRLQDAEQRYGWLEINEQVESLGWIWESRGNATPARIGLYDMAGTLLYANFNGAPGRAGELENGRRLPSGAVVFAADLANADWRLAYFADSKGHELLTGQTMGILAAILLAAFVLMALFSWLALTRVTKPVRKLTDEVRGIRSLDQDFRPPDLRAPEEVAILARAFQDLLVSLRREHTARLRLQGQEMSARMAALQAQLNPHFVFNTLTCIAAYGKKRDGANVQRMCKDLTAMLRYSLQNSNEPATIGQELDQAEVYLALMGRRYAQYLEYRVDRCPDVSLIPVPRLLLQPAIENCFVHGFANTPGPWRVEIGSRLQGTNWEVSVKDSGGGMDTARVRLLLAEFEAALADESPSVFDRDFSRGKLGLLSTFARLRALYGERAVFSLESTEGTGLLVRIGGPHGLP
jgi:two-component system, sensor histidine kinase YesM